MSQSPREEQGTGNWFVGSITDENSRDIDISFDFLEPGVTYDATIYADGPKAHWDKNPTDIKIKKMQLNNTSSMKFHLAPGGGCAISLMKK